MPCANFLAPATPAEPACKKRCQQEQEHKQVVLNRWLPIAQVPKPSVQDEQQQMCTTPSVALSCTDPQTTSPTHQQKSEPQQRSRSNNAVRTDPPGSPRQGLLPPLPGRPACASCPAWRQQPPLLLLLLQTP